MSSEQSDVANCTASSPFRSDGSALVDINHGQLTTDRFRLLTPQPATPEAVTETVAKIVQHGRLGGDVEFTDIFVSHSGADKSPEGRQKKYERTCEF